MKQVDKYRIYSCMFNVASAEETEMAIV